MTHTFTLGDHVELAGALVDQIGGARDVVHDELCAWRYEPSGLWVEIDRTEESRIVQAFSGAPAGPKGKPLKLKASDVAGTITLAHDRIARPGFFAAAPRGIPFSNGFLRVDGTTGAVLEPHARDQRTRAGYPFAYEPRSIPRRFLEFLYSVFRDDDDRCEKESFIQEFFGACVLGIAPVYQLAVVASGKGANGKSVLATIVEASMPPGTTSAVAPQDWGQEYRRAMLVGKHLNVVPELPERDILASESFKAIVTGDPIVARVIRESPVMYRPIAGHYFATNHLPGTPDQSDGFWRRFVVLTFNRSFKGANADPHIAQRILAAEGAAIVSWLVDGALRLMREKAYTIPPSHHGALAAWRNNADQVALFVESDLRALQPDEAPSWGTPGSTLYEAYRNWSERNGHRAMASNRFAERMHGLELGGKKTNRGIIYPVAMVTAADRARVQARAAEVQPVPSPLSPGVFDA